MKGNRTLKKYLALAMAVVFVVSGIIFTPKSTSASTAYTSCTWTPSSSETAKWSFYASRSGTYDNGDTLADGLLLDCTGTADWSGWGDIQAKSPAIAVTQDQNYQISITVDAEVAGTTFALKVLDGLEYELQQKAQTAGEVVYSATYQAKTSSLQVFMVGNGIQEGSYEFKDVSVTEAASTSAAPTTTRGEIEGNIAEGSSWSYWNISNFSSASYAGYTITNSSIGDVWYANQTWIPIVFTVGKAYTCAFKFTTSSPKAFVVDNRTGDATLFVETADSIARGWTNNGDGTYTYFYEGTYTGVTPNSIDVRVSTGYNADHSSNLVGELDTETSWSANDSMTATLSDFIITPTSEYNPGDGYNDCTGSGAQYQANGWGYDRLGNSMGYRTGYYDGYEYVMELKNREETAKNAEVISSQFGDAQHPYLESGKTYRYTLTVRNNASSAITAQIGGLYYYHAEVLPVTTAESVAATSTGVLTDTFTVPTITPSSDPLYGRFQIKLNNIPAGGEVGVISLTIEEVSPWQLVSTYGSFTSMGDWEYYVDSHGEGYYDSNLNPNTYDNVGFKYVAKDSGSGSNNYRMRTSVLSDATGRFNTGDYYDYSFTLAIDDDSEDSLPNAHIKVVEFTGDGVDDYLFLKDVPAVAIGGSTDITGTCGATVNGSRIGIVVDTEDDIALHITDFEVTRRGSEEGILKSSKIAIEGFQIRTNDALASINYRTMCKAPNIGSKITVDGTEYTIDSLGTSYALDTNYDGNDAHNNLDSSYTILDPTPVSSSNPKYQGVKPYAGQNRTHGYIASSEAIIPDWKEGDTANTYYAFTMQGMDDIACYTIWVRPFVKTTTGELIYGNTTAFTSVAEIASHLYTNSLAKNISSHNYLYNSIVHNTSIVPTTNPYYQAEEVVYGWSNTLFIGYRLIPDEWNGEAGGNKEEMQYVTIEDWLIHANSAYGGAQGSYKGVNNDEICVRVDQPGNGFEDEWHNWLNWGIQIRLPNRAAYKRLENGKTYDMTIAYKTNKDGLMRVKCEANTDILTKYQDNPTHSNPGTYTKPGYHEDGIGQYPATAGYNYITERFVYSDGIVHGQNEASIVLMPCPSQGDVEGNGFPAGTIISNISVTFEEVSN